MHEEGWQRAAREADEDVSATTKETLEHVAGSAKRLRFQGADLGAEVSFFSGAHDLEKCSSCVGAGLRTVHC